jgi:hypothetical protein
MPQDQLPRIADLLAPAVTALVGLRPHAAEHIYAGKYGNVIRGFGAQAELGRAYLASEIKAGTLQAEGQALLEYLASEFSAVLDTTPLVGVGHASITRTLVNDVASANALTPGVIRAGTQLSRAGNTGFTPTVESAEYETLEDAVFGTTDTTTSEVDGEFTHVQTVEDIPIRATSAGLHSSVPIFLEDTTPHQTASVGGSLFETDSTWTASIRCAGGFSEAPAEQLRQIAPYLGQAFFGPTSASAVAGALSRLSARYVAYRKNETSGEDRIYVADGAWASSEELSESIYSALVDGRWLGYGARVRPGIIENTPCIVRPTVMVQNEDLTADKTALVETLQKAAKTYFDERPDWYTWSTQTLRAALTAASRKVLTVPSVSVTNRSGQTLTAPPAKLAENTIPTHYYVVGLEPTFTTPS